MRLLALASLFIRMVGRAGAAGAAEASDAAATGALLSQVTLEQKVAQEKAAADKAAREKAAHDQALRQAKDTQQLRAAGYKPVTKAGATLWCRDEQIVGSRVTQAHCDTQESILADTRNGQEMTEQVRLKALATPSLQ